MQELSPLDGRYLKSTEVLRPFFNELALHRARLRVEILYFIALGKEPGVREFPRLNIRQKKALLGIVARFDDKEARMVRTIERKINHDVKAVEYYLREKVEGIAGLKWYAEFVHFGLTSEDVNNLAYGILINDALKRVVIPMLEDLMKDIKKMARLGGAVEMLSLTHGQPAIPTTVGKELRVFVDRLERQLQQLKEFSMQGKFGGAVGNFSAHKAAYPDVNWAAFGKTFVASLGLDPLAYTTQINPHDDLAELSHIVVRINTILINLSRDIWSYISRGIFRQSFVAGEVGSSTMPHKVNPIDFENAEGNLGLSTALFSHFAEKLPISRMQRDLSDSTVQRNIGVAFGYHVLAVSSLRKGLKKLSLDRSAIRAELDAHPEIHAEAIQTVLRKNGVRGAYEKLKELTRGEHVSKNDLRTFVKDLKIPKNEVGNLLKRLR